MAQHETRSWGRAVLLGLMVAAVAAVLLLVVPNLIVTKPVHLARGWRVALAVGWFALCFPLVTWALNRLQARGVL
jgi:hypothetical protein